ncbi:MAG: YjjG family noncanonical pyrimidine nucleotidase [Bacteroidales bacterium]
MNPRYRFLFFDLDRTLWDFQANSEETLNELFHARQLEREIGSFRNFADTWNQHNERLWRALQKGEITKAELRTQRFEATLQAFGIENPLLAAELNSAYLRICPEKTTLLDGALETLNYLKSKSYKLYILSNGFTRIQKIKVAASQLEPYFDQLFTSEWAGCSKPKPGIFRKAFSSVNASKKWSLMIGDDQTTDILGAQNFGIDQVWFNPSGKESVTSPTYEIARLTDLRDKLGL